MEVEIIYNQKVNEANYLHKCLDEYENEID